MIRPAPLLLCVAIGCTVFSPKSPTTAPSAGSSAAGDGAATAATASSSDRPDATIVSYRPSALWNALTRETIPHGWPRDVELRAPRDVAYDPASGQLRIGADAGRGGSTTLRTTAVESVRVVWIPDYVSTQPCPSAAASDSLLLVVPRDVIRESVVAQEPDAALPSDAPAVVFAAVSVEVKCSELSDPAWVATHSATWRPSDQHKRRHRVVGGGQGSAGGRAAHRVLSSNDRVEQHYAQRQPGRSIRGLRDIDFSVHAAIALGDGAPRVQVVHADAVSREQVSMVDVPLTTSACRSSQSADLSELVYLADDTGPAPGRYKVQGSPLFVRPIDDVRHELRFTACSKLFPRWSLRTAHFDPNPSMHLQLYGATPRKERKHQDQIVATPTITEAGDTFNVSIPLLTPITCPDSASKKAMNEAHLVRRAVLRRRFEIPYHNGPMRLVTAEDKPYDAIEWDIDAKPCSQRLSR